MPFRRRRYAGVEPGLVKRATAVAGEDPSKAGRGHPNSATLAKRCHAISPSTPGGEGWWQRPHHTESRSKTNPKKFPQILRAICFVMPIRFITLTKTGGQVQVSPSD